MNKTIIILLLSIFFISCEKEEIAVKSYDRGTTQTSSVSIDPTYKLQVFYNLNSNIIISQNNKTDWDIAFSCPENNNHIILNYAKGMYVWRITNKSFTEVTDTIGFEQNKKWDASSGAVDSTAFSNINDSSVVYLIDLGYNEMGIHLGFKKLSVLWNTNKSYKIRYANLNGTSYNEQQILKDEKYNHVAFSFKLNKVVAFQPIKSTFDLEFTQYTYTFLEPYQSYLVTGVLINKGIKVAKVSSIPFSDIKLSDTLLYSFTSSADAIGYDWKYFNFNDGKYTVDPTKIYIIRDLSGFFYKLHFIDFYNENGQKGNIKFEYQKL